MGKARAPFSQGAPYSLGMGALSEWGHPGGVFQVAYTLVFPVSFLVGPQQEQGEGSRKEIGTVAGSFCCWKCGSFPGGYLAMSGAPWGCWQFCPAQASALDLELFPVALTCTVEGTQMCWACEAPLTQP